MRPGWRSSWGFTPIGDAEERAHDGQVVWGRWKSWKSEARGCLGRGCSLRILVGRGTLVAGGRTGGLAGRSEEWDV